MEFSNKNIDEAGSECNYYSFGSVSGLKVYRDKEVADETRTMQAWLCDEGLAPKVFELDQMYYREEVYCPVAGRWVVGGCCLKNPKPEKRWGFITAVVFPADLVRNVYAKGSALREELLDLFETTRINLLCDLCNLLDYGGCMDLHNANWGFDENSIPVVLDTGTHFFRDIGDKLKKEIGISVGGTL